MGLTQNDLIRLVPPLEAGQLSLPLLGRSSSVHPYPSPRDPVDSVVTSEVQLWAPRAAFKTGQRLLLLPRPASSGTPPVGGRGGEMGLPYLLQDKIAPPPHQPF